MTGREQAQAGRLEVKTEEQVNWYMGEVGRPVAGQVSGAGGGRLLCAVSSISHGVSSTHEAEAPSLSNVSGLLSLLHLSLSLSLSPSTPLFLRSVHLHTHTPPGAARGCLVASFSLIISSLNLDPCTGDWVQDYCSQL